MEDKKFICSICGTVYSYDYKMGQKIHSSIIMFCPKDRGVCWPYEPEDFFEFKKNMLEKYSKEELWRILEKMRADKAIVDNKEFKIKKEGDKV